MHGDSELVEEDGLGTGDVRNRNCWTVVVSTFITLAFSMNMTRVFLSSGSHNTEETVSVAEQRQGRILEKISSLEKC